MPHDSLLRDRFARIVSFRAERLPVVRHTSPAALVDLEFSSHCTFAGREAFNFRCQYAIHRNVAMATTAHWSRQVHTLAVTLLLLSFPEWPRPRSRKEAVSRTDRYAKEVARVLLQPYPTGWCISAETIRELVSDIDRELDESR